MHFSVKVKKKNSQNVTINGYTAGSCFLQKHLVLVLNENLKFNEYF